MYINVEIYIYKQPHKLHPNIVQNKTDKANFNTHPNRLDGFHQTLLPITCNLKIRFSNKLSSFCVSRHLRFRQPQKLRCKTNGDFSSSNFSCYQIHFTSTIYRTIFVAGF